ncbi:Carotenoid oxygenase [Arachis hypogaea]|nr:Carotenoid oxygenase [Arachis hypogaea]
MASSPCSLLHTQPMLRSLQQITLQIDASKAMKSITTKFLDAVVDSVFQFVDVPRLPSQVPNIYTHTMVFDVPRYHPLY